MSLDLLWFIISFFKADSIMDSLTPGPGYMYTSSEHLYESQLCVWKVRRDGSVGSDQKNIEMGNSSFQCKVLHHSLAQLQVCPMSAYCDMLGPGQSCFLYHGQAGFVHYLLKQRNLKNLQSTCSMLARAKLNRTFHQMKIFVLWHK